MVSCFLSPAPLPAGLLFSLERPTSLDLLLDPPALSSASGVAQRLLLRAGRPSRAARHLLAAYSCSLFRFFAIRTKDDLAGSSQLATVLGIRSQQKRSMHHAA